MTNQELFELMDRFSASGLTGLRLTQKDVSLELTRNGGAAPAAPAAACAPDAVPFVTAGAQVSEGQTVCLIEAMKMMNEVKAPCDCMVEELYGRDGELVEFGAPLLRYRPL